MNKRITLLLIILLFSGYGFAQKYKLGDSNGIKILNETKYKKAEKLFSHLAYAGAIPLYEELGSANYFWSKVVRRLAVSYNNVKDYKNAEKWYEQWVQQDSVPVSEIYNYAQILRTNQKYEDAAKWLDKFNELNDEDYRGHKHKNSKSFVKELKDKGNRAELTNMEKLNSKNADFGAVYFKDEILFASSRSEGIAVKNIYAWNNQPFLDLYLTEVNAEEDSTYIKSFNNKFNTKFHEGPVCVSKDQKTIYFTRNNYEHGKTGKSEDGINHLLIFRGDLDEEGSWKIVSMPFNNDEYSVGHPALSEDETKLYFVSNKPGGIGGTDIYYVEIDSAENYSTSYHMGSVINTEGAEMFPFERDGFLFFSSDGHVGLGGLDVFSAFKGDRKFHKIENVGIPINSSFDDFAFVLIEDNMTGFMASNRPEGKGDDDIYKFKLHKPFSKGVTVIINVIDAMSKEPVDTSVVQLIKGKTVLDEIGVSKGTTSLTLDFGKTYKLVGTAIGYADNEMVLDIPDDQQEDISVTIELEDNSFSIFGIIMEKVKKKPIKGSEVIITDLRDNSLFLDSVTTKLGAVWKSLSGYKVGDSLKLRVDLKCEGYLDKSQVFAIKLEEVGQINLHDFLDFSMDKIDVGLDLAKIIDIKPIYFDLSKWNIREDAAVELDKIVKVMKENPKMEIELGSHTDARGSDKSNETLSDKRAKSSAEYIVSKGIDAARITGKGYGEYKLVNKCKDGVKCSEEEHQENRRTEFIIVKM